MPAQMTELPFLEHIAGRFNLPVPEFLTAEAGAAQIRDAIRRWGGKALVKPDVLSGRRGKAGAVTVVTDYVEAQRQLKHAQSLEVNSHLCRTAYLTQYVPAEMEVYSAILKAAESHFKTTGMLGPIAESQITSTALVQGEGFKLDKITDGPEAPEEKEE